MRLLTASLLALLAAPVSAQTSSFIDVSGNIAWGDEPLPPRAEVVIRVLDTSPTDGSARPLAEKRLVAGGARGPAPFVLTVDRDLVAPGARITVTANIVHGKQTLFTTDRIYPILTNDQPAQADLMLVKIAGEQPRPRRSN